MSVAEQPQLDGMLVTRRFDVELSQGDGRTLIGRCVPYNTPALVADPPDFMPYREEWLPGVFDNQLAAPNRVLLDFEHEPGIGNVLGRGVDLASRTDGLHGIFRVYENIDGDKALQMYHDGVLRALSIFAKPLKSRRGADGVVQRVRAHLDKVALCRQGAFDQAEVLAVRTHSPTGDELPELVPFDPALATLLERHVAVPPELRLLERAFTEQAWDGSPSRWPDPAAYCQSCVIDDNPAGQDKTKALCHLPIKEPGSGDININAVRNAMARLDQVQTSQANKDRARRRLQQLMNQFGSQG